MDPLGSTIQDRRDLPPDERLQTEVAVLEKYGLRWAVLVAWADELAGMNLRLPPEITRKLEEARIKIASGCFSACTVGCALSAIEASLLSAATSTGGEPAEKSVDFWMELLAHAMSDAPAFGKLLSVPAVKFHYARCGSGACDCAT